MPRHTLVACLFVLATLNFAHGQDGPAASQQTANPLSKSIDSMNFDRAPLERIVRELAEYAEVNIVVDWPALRESKIAGDTPVTIRLKDVTVSTVLDSVLAQARRGDAGLTYDARGNTIFITTRSLRDRITEIRVYDCRELAIPPLSDAERQIASATGHVGACQRAESRRRMNEIVSAICATVDHNSWRDESTSIRTVGNTLIIRQTAQNHENIATLLSRLRLPATTGQRAPKSTSAAH